MKYLKPIDIWTYGQAIRDGQLKLQKGQWIRCGDSPNLSRFHSVKENGTIIAFHYPSASKKFLKYIRPDCVL